MRPCTTIRRCRADRGFTLIEVVLALMVVALGLLGLFHLFPSGLRASYDATVETRTAQFADEVFGGIRARAFDLPDQNAYWIPTQVNRFRAEAVTEIETIASQKIIHTGPEWADYHREVAYPPGGSIGTREYLRYTLDINVPDKNLATARLVVRYGRAGGEERKFYTEFYNYGSVR